MSNLVDSTPSIKVQDEKKLSTWVHIVPGVLLSFLLALPSDYLGSQFPIIGGPVFAILIGMSLVICFPQLTKRSLFNHRKHGSIHLDEGIKYTSKKLLQLSIILLGFEMNLYHIIKVGHESLYIMFFTLSVAFLIAYLMGKWLKLSNHITLLIGVGTSICGGSAIAATAPVIQANEEDIASSISTIFLFNIVAVFIFPMLGHQMEMSDLAFGMWAGTAINDTSSVVAATSAWSSIAGNNDALTFAVIVKLTRVLMIVPITLFLALYIAHQKKKSHNEQNRDNFSLIQVFPWFILIFILVAIVNTFASLPSEWSEHLVKMGKFMIVMAMVAIGLNTHIKKLMTNGFKPILLGVSCWVAVALTSLFVQSFV